ncbi:hypothetical protein [Vibrio sp. Hal054]|uniref:hypothetical protein n=1 Tax=Vibrio sp. Hal054 TaxID=3035158 RepID=UPI00301CBB34
MDRQQYKDEFIKRGWTVITLAKRWSVTPTRIHQIAVEVETNHKKAQAHLDMLHGLPYLEKR